MKLTPVDVGTLSLRAFDRLLEPTDVAHLRAAERLARSLLDGRIVWNLNSTARGGGVAEMLTSLLAYARGVGIDARWMVVTGGAEFFAVTKRLHNRLHGAPGDGGPLGEAERAVYDMALAPNGIALRDVLGPHDVVILHDPQTAGLIPTVRAHGNPVIWRCHVGLDEPNDLAREAWRFLQPYVMQADAYVFSRRAFVWDDLDPDRRVIIPPSIDAFSPKNQELEASVAKAILTTAGLREQPTGPCAPAYRRLDGTVGVVRRRSRVTEERPLRAGERYVLQVSRWDRLKDPLGVIDGFARHMLDRCDAHLVYAGPDVTAVRDDPEGTAVLAEARALWHQLPPEARERIHLAELPCADQAENAAIVNALQTMADVVVQKSLAEGFGLTVAEAMWKARPVVASAIGGIEDQIEDGVTGVLLRDPLDLASYADAIVDLLGAPERAALLGARARARVRDRYLGSRSLLDYLELLERLLAPSGAARTMRGASTVPSPG